MASTTNECWSRRKTVRTVPGTGSDLSRGVGSTTRASGGWSKGLPKWVKGAKFAKGVSGVGIAGLVASETTADQV